MLCGDNMSDRCRRCDKLLSFLNRSDSSSPLCDECKQVIHAVNKNIMDSKQETETRVRRELADAGSKLIDDAFDSIGAVFAFNKNRQNDRAKSLKAESNLQVKVGQIIEEIQKMSKAYCKHLREQIPNEEYDFSEDVSRISRKDYKQDEMDYDHYRYKFIWDYGTYSNNKEKITQYFGTDSVKQYVDPYIQMLDNIIEKNKFPYCHFGEKDRQSLLNDLEQYINSRSKSLPARASIVTFHAFLCGLEKNAIVTKPLPPPPKRGFFGFLR